MRNKKCLILLVITIILMLALLSIIIKQKFYRYDVNMKIIKYDLRQEKDDYLNYLKKLINPIKLRNFIDNDAATGEDVIDQMMLDGYKYLFNSLFSNNQINFDECPVTKKFKEKFNDNLLNYFNLNESEDCESMCSLNRKDKEIIVEVYGNFKNTEPTYWTTHHFHYTLDDEGNVDDIVFDHTDK